MSEERDPESEAWESYRDGIAAIARNIKNGTDPMYGLRAIHAAGFRAGLATRTPGPEVAAMGDTIERLSREIRDLKQAGTAYSKERDTMNGLILANEDLKRLARTPGPATAAMEACRRLVEWSESENDAGWPLIRVVTLARSFLAEHGAARPGKAVEP